MVKSQPVNLNSHNKSPGQPVLNAPEMNPVLLLLYFVFSLWGISLLQPVKKGVLVPHIRKAAWGDENNILPMDTVSVAGIWDTGSCERCRWRKQGNRCSDVLPVNCIAVKMLSFPRALPTPQSLLIGLAFQNVPILKPDPRSWLLPRKRQGFL